MTVAFWVSLALIAISIGMFIQEPRRVINAFVLECGIYWLMHSTIPLLANDQHLYQVVYWGYVVLIVFLIAFGLILLCDWFLMLKREGFSKANLLPLAFGMLTMIVGVWGIIDMNGGISGSTWEVFWQSIVLNLVMYTPLALSIVLLFALVYVMIPKHKADYIIVLGCRIRKDGTPTPLLRDRLDRAIRYWKKYGKAPTFIVSGGKGTDECISEAESMQKYLIAHGVPENQILVEDKSTSTQENLLFSHRLVDPAASCIICTSNYHVPRAVVLAYRLHLADQGIGGHTALYYLPAAFFREYIAFVYNNKYALLIYLAITVIFAWPMV